MAEKTESAYRESKRALTARVKHATLFTAGFSLGALAAYLFDPHQGARRRALLGDQSAHAARASARRGLKLLRHSRNQLEGLVASASSLVVPSGPTSDRKLLDRIRSRLGHAAEHTKKLEIEVRRGDVVLKGEVPESELSAIIETIRTTRGVRTVSDSIARPEAGVGVTVQ